MLSIFLTSPHEHRLVVEYQITGIIQQSFQSSRALYETSSTMQASMQARRNHIQSSRLEYCCRCRRGVLCSRRYLSSSPGQGVIWARKVDWLSGALPFLFGIRPCVCVYRFVAMWKQTPRPIAEVTFL